MNSTALAIGFLFLYFLPTLIAKRGRRASVGVINTFFGWTVLGWVIALFLAVRSLEVPQRGV